MSSIRRARPRDRDHRVCLRHPDVEATSFVGSTAVANHLYETGARNGKRIQASGGAKNHLLVMPDADLEKTGDAQGFGGWQKSIMQCWPEGIFQGAEFVMPVAS